jgi:glycine betaine/proline transport system substrate-binding protein
MSLNVNLSHAALPVNAPSRLKKIALGLGLATTLFGIASVVNTAAAADSPQCEIQRPVMFGGMNWESNLVMVEAERFIMEKGYGCKTDVTPASTLAALAALERGDLDINSEVWLNSVGEPWDKALASGKVKRIGDLYMGGEAWFIPRYTADRLPGLKKASDLPKYKDDFKDPEEPGKGRFYGCPAGWGCEVVSGNLFKALKLDKTFTLFSPGTGATQKAALMAAYKRKENVAFYYWYPTPLVGALDLVKLKMPAYDAARQKCLTNPKCEKPEPSDYPQNPVFTAVSTQFTQQAPVLSAFLAKVKMPLETMDQLMAHLEKTQDEPEDTAKWFLQNDSAIWTKWVPADVASRVKAAL